MLFAKSAEVARSLGERFQAHEVEKRYLALVRGWVLEPFEVDRPLKEPLDKLGDAHVERDKPIDLDDLD